MNSTPVMLSLALLACLSIGSPARAADKGTREGGNDASKQAYQVFAKYCAQCHHETKKGNDDFDVLDWKSLTSVKPSDDIADRYPNVPAYVTPGKLDKSLVWLRMSKGEMPPGGPRRGPPTWTRTL